MTLTAANCQVITTEEQAMTLKAGTCHWINNIVKWIPCMHHQAPGTDVWQEPSIRLSGGKEAVSQDLPPSYT